MSQILIVDDLEENLKNVKVVLKDILTEKDDKTFTAKNKKNAIEIIKDNKIDLLISDIRLVDGDSKNKEGLDVVEEALSRRIKTIITTRFFNDETIIKRIKELSSNKFLIRSFVYASFSYMSELEKEIANALNRPI